MVRGSGPVARLFGAAMAGASVVQAARASVGQVVPVALGGQVDLVTSAGLGLRRAARALVGRLRAVVHFPMAAAPFRTTRSGDKK